MTESSKVPIGILALQGDYAAHQRMLWDMNVPTVLVKKAEQLESVKGLILPGGESTTLLKFLDGESLWGPLKQFGASHPILGTCAGAILLASAVENPAQRSLGLMDITIRRNAFGRQVFSFIRHATFAKAFLTQHPELDSNDGKTEAVFIRAPLILRTGSAVQTLATLDGSPVLVQQGKYLAATFHPELSTDGPGAYAVHRHFCQLAS